jgi:hypothetical protein
MTQNNPILRKTVCKKVTKRLRKLPSEVTKKLRRTHSESFPAVRSVGMVGVLDGPFSQEDLEGFTNEFFISVGMLF